MTERQGIELARDFVRSEFVDRGMIADLNVHWDMAEDGMLNPHAHVMLTMRSFDENGFGPKVREWSRTELLERWREIARNNGARIIADPSIALDAITHQQSTFTRRDMAMFAHRHSDGSDQFNAVMGAMRDAPDLVQLGKDTRSDDRFTTRQMIETEQRLHRAADLMAAKERHEVGVRDREAALARAEARGLFLSGEQADALEHVTDGRDLGVVVAWRAKPGKRRATTLVAWRCPASPPRISKADRASRRAPSPAWNTVGDRVAMCSPRAMFR
jgi:hypothetical protein